MARLRRRRAEAVARGRSRAARARRDRAVPPLWCHAEISFDKARQLERVADEVNEHGASTPSRARQQTRSSRDSPTGLDWRSRARRRPRPWRRRWRSPRARTRPRRAPPRSSSTPRRSIAPSRPTTGTRRRLRPENEGGGAVPLAKGAALVARRVAAVLLVRVDALEVVLVRVLGLVGSDGRAS